MTIGTGIQTYTSVAASNIALFPEGMAPSAVNDGMRQVQKDIRDWYVDAEWVNWGDAPSRASAATFKIPTDVTSRYVTHRRVKCYDATTIYATVTASSYSAPDTTVTVVTDSGSLTTSLTAVAVGILLPTGISVPSTIGRKGADIASATTTDIGAATGDFVDITGTTTITGLGNAPTIGVLRQVRFTGALILTYNATSLILPGAANITTAAGDTAVFRSLNTSGNWICVSYTRADGTSLAGSSTPQYLTLANDASLANERVFTPGTGLAGTDGGANSTYTLKSAAGVPVQVVQGTLTSTASTSSSSFADTGVAVTITPAINTNKVLITATVFIGQSTGENNSVYIRLIRGAGTVLIQGDVGGSKTRTFAGMAVANNTLGTGTVTLSYLDSPATTSATTYKVQYLGSNGAATVYLNRSSADTDTSAYPRGTSTIIAMEIMA